MEPPLVEERRRLPDRRRTERAESRGRYPRKAAAAAVGVCGGLALVYLFFAAIGAVDLAEALGASAVALVMGLVWLGGYLLSRRQAEGTVGDRLERERRGF
ncbi:MAG TPA: hypothetical protein VF517_10760 [Thermoleophilaceae bacterium]